MEYLRLIQIFTPDMMIDISKVLIGIALLLSGVVLFALLGLYFLYQKTKDNEQTTGSTTSVD
jgi:hypothetical protein